MQPFLAKLIAALACKPSANDLRHLALELVWLVPALALCVALSSIMQWQPRLDAATLRLAAIAIILPSLGEELFFRAALLPRSEPDQPLPEGRAALALALFVAWHPAQTLFTGDERTRIFLDPWFLVAVAAVGIACTRVYWKSASLWPAVLLHWLVVVGWKAFAGGPELI